MSYFHYVSFEVWLALLICDTFGWKSMQLAIMICLLLYYCLCSNRKQSLSLQISSHVKAIDSIYQATDFMGIRNISFMVKRIRVSLTSMHRLRRTSGECQLPFWVLTCWLCSSISLYNNRLEMDQAGKSLFCFYQFYLLLYQWRGLYFLTSLL